MKRQALLVISGILALGAAGCQTDPWDPIPAASEDETLAGETVPVGEDAPPVKLFVLNEGAVGSNSATLDFFRFTDGKYVRDAYGKMNPEIPFGLGDVGNDIAVDDGKVWMVVNNSGIVEVADAFNEKHIATIQVMTPRNIAFDDSFAYVTSWAGTFVEYNDDHTVKDHLLRKGQLYKIDKHSCKQAAVLDLPGYEPEGIAVYDGKAYVALSGGTSSAVTSNYERDVVVVDLASFKVEKTIDVATNLKSVFSDGKGWIYVTCYGDFYSVHSGLYAFKADGSEPVRHISAPGTNGYVTAAAIAGDTVWAIGTEDEWDYTAGKVKDYYLFTARLADGSKSGKRITDFVHKNPMAYSLGVLGDGNGDFRYLFVGDQTEWNAPGTLTCYGSDCKKRWSAATGSYPGHFAFYTPKSK